MVFRVESWFRVYNELSYNEFPQYNLTETEEYERSIILLLTCLHLTDGSLVVGCTRF